MRRGGHVHAHGRARLARSFVRGKGTFDTPNGTDLRARKHGGTRVLLQPA